jgi:hypothetical protein
MLCASACGGQSFEGALKSHLQKSPPDTSQVRDLGGVRSVRCYPAGLPYRGSHVYSCDVTYANGDSTELCAARVDGQIVTQQDDRTMPCTAHPLPAPNPTTSK